MKIAVPRENSNENRVAMTPAVAKSLIQIGFEVIVEKGAGLRAHYSDASFQEAGAKIAASSKALLQDAQILATVGLPTTQQIDSLKEGSIVIGFLQPFAQTEITQKLLARNITSFSLELIPRTSRAQSMDALSSQASLAGYKAVILAAHHLGKYFPMLMTAAGTITPSRVLVIGVGVAGLQAIATAKRLGATVEAYDIRPEVKDQVISLGAKFVEMEIQEETNDAGGYAKEVTEATKLKQREKLAKHVQMADIVITTAQVPGKKAPLLVDEAMVRSMRAGSVIIDMAAYQGGNVALSEVDKEVDVDGVLVLGPSNLPSTAAFHASELLSKNIFAFLKLWKKDGAIQFHLDDEILKSSCLTHQGEVMVDKIKSNLVAARKG